MQIKAADDKKAVVAELTELLSRPNLPQWTRGRIEQEIRTVRAGEHSERDAAYQIEFMFGDNAHIMTIHDLRLEIGGRVAQIDHLILDRFFEMWVCESKSFAEGVAINEHGEWSAYYGRRLRGIPSPIEQNKRHLDVLREVFKSDGLSLPRRLGITLKPRLESIVLVSNSAHIMRPRGAAAARVEGLDRVIKCEQLRVTLNRVFEGKKTGEMVEALVKVVSRETVERVARELAALHKPTKIDWLARFGVEEHPPTSSGPERPTSVSAGAVVGKWREIKTGQVLGADPRCELCGVTVSAAVVEYCRDHSQRFVGRILCMRCQRRA
jgi:hypothetical protein